MTDSASVFGGSVSDFWGKTTLGMCLFSSAPVDPSRYFEATTIPRMVVSGGSSVMRVVPKRTS